jgi:hypothetical protein
MLESPLRACTRTGVKLVAEWRANFQSATYGLSALLSAPWPRKNMSMLSSPKQCRTPRIQWRTWNMEQSTSMHRKCRRRFPRRIRRLRRSPLEAVPTGSDRLQHDTRTKNQ